MDQVFSVDDISDPFCWPSSPNPPILDSQSSINRSSSVWLFEKFLEINPNPNTTSDDADSAGTSVVVGSNFGGGGATKSAGNEAVEIKKADEVVDPEHVAELKKKLNMYCAVAISRNSSANPKDIASVGDCSSPGSDASHLVTHGTGKGIVLMHLS